MVDVCVHDNVNCSMLFNNVLNKEKKMSNKKKTPKKKTPPKAVEKVSVEQANIIVCESFHSTEIG